MYPKIPHSINFIKLIYFQFIVTSSFVFVIDLRRIEATIFKNFQIMWKNIIGKTFNFQQIRRLSLQENVSMALLNCHGITTPKFMVAKTDKEAEQGAKDLCTKNLVVKAQVLSGGRGLGKFENGFQGGVHAVTK